MHNVQAIHSICRNLTMLLHVSPIINYLALSRNLLQFTTVYYTCSHSLPVNHYFIVANCPGTVRDILGFCSLSWIFALFSMVFCTDNHFFLLLSRNCHCQSCDFFNLLSVRCIYACARPTLPRQVHICTRAPYASPPGTYMHARTLRFPARCIYARAHPTLPRQVHICTRAHPTLPRQVHICTRAPYASPPGAYMHTRALRFPARCIYARARPTLPRQVHIIIYAPFTSVARPRLPSHSLTRVFLRSRWTLYRQLSISRLHFGTYCKRCGC